MGFVSMVYKSNFKSENLPKRAFAIQNWPLRRNNEKIIPAL